VAGRTPMCSTCRNGAVRLDAGDHLQHRLARWPSTPRRVGHPPPQFATHAAPTHGAPCLSSEAVVGRDVVVATEAPNTNIAVTPVRSLPAAWNTAGAPGITARSPRGVRQLVQHLLVRRVQKLDIPRCSRRLPRGVHHVDVEVDRVPSTERPQFEFLRAGRPPCAQPSGRTHPRRRHAGGTRRRNSRRHTVVAVGGG
jgi:hypothetical protein